MLLTCIHPSMRFWRCALCGVDLWPTHRLRLLKEYGAKVSMKGLHSEAKMIEWARLDGARNTDQPLTNDPQIRD